MDTLYALRKHVEQIPSSSTARIEKMETDLGNLGEDIETLERCLEDLHDEKVQIILNEILEEKNEDNNEYEEILHDDLYYHLRIIF
jgi:hypothetical protein